MAKRSKKKRHKKRGKKSLRKRKLIKKRKKISRKKLSKETKDIDGNLVFKVSEKSKYPALDKAEYSPKECPAKYFALFKSKLKSFFIRLNIE